MFVWGLLHLLCARYDCSRCIPFARRWHVPSSTSERVPRGEWSVWCVSLSLECARMRTFPTHQQRIPDSRFCSPGTSRKTKTKTKLHVLLLQVTSCSDTPSRVGHAELRNSWIWDVSSASWIAQASCCQASPSHCGKPPDTSMLSKPETVSTTRTTPSRTRTDIEVAHARTHAHTVKSNVYLHEERIARARSQLHRAALANPGGDAHTRHDVELFIARPSPPVVG